MIDGHSLEVLEFPRVKELAAAGAGSERGAAFVRALEPIDDLELARQRLRLTDELRRLLESADGFPAIDPPDVRASLERLAAQGVVLDPPELRDLARLAGVARRIRERLAPGGRPDAFIADFPLAVDIAGRIRPCPELERAVAETFGPHDDILDSASGALRSIRRHLRQQRERILGRLALTAKSAHGEDERTVTLRGDRYVVAVRASDRHEVGGIVHDRSGTGATVYLEPLAVVEENNRLVELLVEEREEIRRILAELSELARGRRSDLARQAEELAVLDGHRALARLAETQGATWPQLTLTPPRLRLIQFRHPLLLADRGRDVVPLDLELGVTLGDGSAPRRVMLLTGPNMGGKTVALKGVGLACVMAAAGFHLPAGSGSEVPLLTTLVADIGDEQSIQHDLSTFASHLRRWIEAVDGAGPPALALLDEIGAGTDPAEGAALAQAILERLADAGGLAIVTTHLGALKRFASRYPAVSNGSMLFDPVSERPLFRLEPGLPGQSRALEMARNLGLSAEILARAGALVGDEEKEIQALLTQLETARQEALAERRAAADAVAEANAARQAYADRGRRLEGMSEALKARAAREAQRILTRAESRVRDAQAAVDDAARQSSAEAAQARRRLADARRVVAEARSAADTAAGLSVPTPGRAIRPEELTAGRRFWAVPLASWVTVVAPPERDGKVRVERNGIRVELPPQALRAAPEEATASGGPSLPARGPEAGAGGRRRVPADGELPPDSPAARRGSVVYQVPEGVRGEIDLRGLLAEEAIARLDFYLDEAGLAGLTEVRIIHGKGTGALRTAVQKWLKGRPDVLSYRIGETWEGSTGVTVARLEP